MPEPAEDASDRVHVEDWMKFQAGEQQDYMPDATSSSSNAPEAVDRHARFFLPAGNIYFSIEDTLYSVPRAPFERHSSAAFAGKGLTEDEPLILEDVKAAHFDHLMSILYPSEYGSGEYTAVTVDDWTAVLHLAVRWGLQPIKTLAITRLTPIATDIDKIVLGRQYGINPWLHEAFIALCMREQSVTEEEGSRMKIDDVVKINAIRQLFRQGAQPMQASALSIGETCAGFDTSLPEPAMPAVSEEAGSAEKSREGPALFLEQLKHLRKSCLAQFRKEMLDGLRGDICSFATGVAKARERCETRFKASSQVAIVEGTDWTWDDEMNLLSNEIVGEIVGAGYQCRRDETEKMLDLIERNFEQQISEPVTSALSKASPRMWDQVLASYKKTLQKAENTHFANAKSLNCTEEENGTALATLRKRAWLALRAKIDEQTADIVILSKMRGHFEKQFCYGEHGALRVWTPQDDLDGAFKRARDQTLELLQLYSKISPVDKSRAYILPPDAGALSLPDEERDFGTTLTVLTEKKKLHLAAQFHRDAHVYYFDARHSAMASIVTILVCVYGGLVVLSFRAARYCLESSLALTAKFRHDAGAYCVEVKRSMVASIATNRVWMELTPKVRRIAGASYIAVKRGVIAIPIWMYIVLVLLLLLWWGQLSDKSVAVLFNRPSWLSFQRPE